MLEEIEALIDRTTGLAWEIAPFALSILVFGVLLYLIPTAVLDICLVIAVIGVLYHLILSYFEDHAITPPWPVAKIPIWCFFALPAGGSLIIHIHTANANIAQVVVLCALLVVFFYFWFIIPAAWHQKRRKRAAGEDRQPPSSTLSVLVPAYNEEGYIGECVAALTEARYPNSKEILVIDDGSTDNTYEEASAHATANVKVVQQSNEGKYSALNTGLEQATGEVIVTVDADSIVAENALVQIVADLESDPSVGAVAGTVKLLRTESHIEKLQALEYALGINTFRRAFAALGFVNVVPGCLGCFRKTALNEVGGYDGDTMTEDFDATVKLLRSGWNVQASEAIAYTEPPGTWNSLYKQRIRWSWGNLETLLKHRDVLWSRQINNFTGLLFPYQIVSLVAIPFATVIILLTIAHQLAIGNIIYVSFLLAMFTLLQFTASLFALVLDDNDLRLCLYAPAVVVVYKHFIDAIALKSLFDVVRRTDRTWTHTRDRPSEGTQEPMQSQSETAALDVEVNND